MNFCVFWLRNKQHVAGSKSYGTDVSTSDTDIRGIFATAPEYTRTPFFNVREQDIKDEEDGKLYELNNFMKLYCDGNPNILETLWVESQFITESSEAYEVLKHHRQELLSKKVAFTYSGYAIQQLRRIKGHNKYINKPQPETPPRQIDYVKLIHNFTDQKILKLNMEDIHDGYRLVHYGGNIFGVYQWEGFQTYDHLFTLNGKFDDITSVHLKEQNLFEKIVAFTTNNPDFGKRRMPLFLVKYNEEQYHKDKDEWKSYWSWKRNRNPARRELEEHNGFDTKHAMHLVRLLNMAEEILTTGEVKVYRPDRELLKDIRSGKYSYEEVLAMVEGKDQYVRKELYKKSYLPEEPDLKLASKVLMDVQDLVWDSKRS